MGGPMRLALAYGDCNDVGRACDQGILAEKKSRLSGSCACLNQKTAMQNHQAATIAFDESLEEVSRRFHFCHFSRKPPAKLTGGIFDAICVQAQRCASDIEIQVIKLDEIINIKEPE